jgi:hypothetical protein
MKPLYVVFAILALFITGCSFGSTTSDSSYMTGKSGVSMQFLPNNPPSTIYLNNNFAEDTPIVVEAFNRGTSPAGNIQAFFVGFDDNLVTVNDLNFDLSSDGDYKTRYNPEGGFDEQETELRVNDLGNADTYEFNLKLVYCYDYVTRAAVQVCVDPNPNRVNKDDACTPSSVSTSGQGAPIGITSIDQEAMPGNVRLKINVQHYGQGKVLRSGAQCEGVPLRADENYVTFSEPTLAGNTGTCVTTSPLKLRNGQGTIICNFPLDRSTLPCP